MERNARSRGNGHHWLAAWLLLTSASVAHAQEEEEAGAETAVATEAEREGETADDGEAEWRLRPPVVDGYIQVRYRHSFPTAGDGDNDNSEFRVQRVRIGVEGEVQPWLSYDIEIDPRAPEVTGILRDAFIGVHVIPRHELRLGQQKTQFGYENRISSTRLYTVNRTEVADNLSRGTNLRDLGIGLVGDIRINEHWRFEDAITLTNGQGMNVQEDMTATKNLWGRVGIRYRRGDFTLRWGVSGAYGDIFEAGDPDVGEEAHTIGFWRVGTDVELDHEWFFVVAEYVMGQDDVPAMTTPEVTEAETEDVSGYYGLVAIKTPFDMGPMVRFDTEGDFFQRWTFGAFYGDRRDAFRVLVNYELRSLIDDVRGDDKFMIWTQVRF